MEQQQTPIQKFNAIKVDIRSVLIAMILSAGAGVHFAGTPATQTLIPAAATAPTPTTTVVQHSGE